jgi:hypothetical protein
MNFSVSAVTLSFGLTIVLVLSASDTVASDKQRTPDIRLVQANPDAAGGANTTNLRGTGLTASHKQIIYDNIAGEQAQTLSGDFQFGIGSTVPDLLCSVIPIAVKDQIGLLKDFKFVKLTGDKILVVDLANRNSLTLLQTAPNDKPHSAASPQFVLWKNAPGWRQFRREHLVHATAIEIDHLKAPAIFVKAIGHRWQLSEAIQY